MLTYYVMILLSEDRRKVRGIRIMNNAEWMVQNGYKFSDINVCYELDKTVTFSLNGAIVGKASYGNTCLDTFKAWLDQEHKEPILNDSEKSYLSAVIKPFRNRVQYIEKMFDDSLLGDQDCYLFIRFNDGNYDMNFPAFRESIRYKGMKRYKKYTLEELGL